MFYSSTKILLLIHGTIWYLKLFEISLVKMSLEFFKWSWTTKLLAVSKQAIYFILLIFNVSSTFNNTIPVTLNNFDAVQIYNCVIFIWIDCVLLLRLYTFLLLACLSTSNSIVTLITIILWYLFFVVFLRRIIWL